MNLDKIQMSASQATHTWDEESLYQVTEGQVTEEDLLFLTCFTPNEVLKLVNFLRTVSKFQFVRNMAEFQELGLKK